MHSFSVSSVFIKSAICLTSVLCVSAVQANASASASLSNVRFSLTDLDPLDGITPWLVFDTDVNSSIELITEAIGAGQPFVTTKGDAPFGDVSASILEQNAQAQGWVNSAEFDAESKQLGASVSAANGWTATSTVSLPGFPYSFTLSPQTAVTLSADLGQVSVQVSNGDPFGIASAEAVLQIWKNDGSWPFRDAVNVDVISDPEASISSGQAQSADANSMVVSLSNVTNAVVSGGMQASLNVWAISSVGAAVVPEPATWMLMALGLGGVALLRFSRQS